MRFRHHRSIVLIIAWMLLSVAPVLPAQAAPAAPQGETLYLPWVGSRVCNGPLPPTVFGVQMYGATGARSPYLVSLQESGARWVRVTVEWRRIEPENTTPDRYDWRHADSVLAAAKDACVHIIATHRSAPAWAASNPDGPLDRTSLDELAQYLAALVERYDGDGKDDAPGSPEVRHWELYNEPDVVSTTGQAWGNTPQKYAAMLKKAYPAIKRASPKAQVLLGGIAYDAFTDKGGWFNRKFLEGVLAAGGGDYFDIMNFHSFPTLAGTWADQGPGLLEKTAFLRSELKRLGVKPKPIFITETGHYVNSVGSFPASPEVQARFVVQLYTQALAADVKSLIWFTLYDLTDVKTYNQTGLVTNDFPPRRRPSFDAYRFAAAQLNAARFERRLTAAEVGADDMAVYHFVDAARRVDIHVAWLNPVNTTNKKPLTLRASQVVVRNAYGEPAIVLDRDDGKLDGSVTVRVGGQPVYIEMSR